MCSAAGRSESQLWQWHNTCHYHVLAALPFADRVGRLALVPQSVDTSLDKLRRKANNECVHWGDTCIVGSQQNAEHANHGPKIHQNKVESMPQLQWGQAGNRDTSIPQRNLLAKQHHLSGHQWVIILPLAACSYTVCVTKESHVSNCNQW